MEIIIGKAPSVGPADRQGPAGKQSSGTEATMLSIRAPRRRSGLPPDGNPERRWVNGTQDPANGRVVTLLVPNGDAIPKDIHSGHYRVLLRFVPRK